MEMYWGGGESHHNRGSKHALTAVDNFSPRILWLLPVFVLERFYFMLYEENWTYMEGN